MAIQIESNLFNRQGKAITNFKDTLPLPQADLAKETLKDPYVFSFLTLERNVQELELEHKLVDNITKFLMELGKGWLAIHTNMSCKHATTATTLNAPDRYGRKGQ